MNKRWYLVTSIFIIVGGIFSSTFPFPNNLVAYYPLNGNAKDLSGNGNNGTIYGALTVKGMHDSALYFDGSSSYIFIPDSSIFTFPNGLSISAWIRPELKNMWYRIVDKEYTTSMTTPTNEWAFGMALTGGLYFGIDKGSTQYSVNGTSPVNVNAWRHVTGTWDGSTMRIYLNGVLQSETAQVTPPINHSTNPVLIGKGAGNTYYFKGIIDELMIFSRALTAAEIDSIFSGVYYPGDVPPIPVPISCSPNPTFDRRPVLRWHSNASISTFRIQVATNPTFVSPAVSVPTTDTFYFPTSDFSIGINYWRVRNEADTFSWSNMSTVTILDSTIPVLIPVVPDPTRNRRPNLEWHRVSKASTYNIQISTIPGFSSLFISDAVADTIYKISADLPLGTIYWRVASNLNTQFSTPDTFTVLNDSIPWLIPMIPDTQYNRMPRFEWHSAAGASQYRIQIDTVGYFSNPDISLPIQVPETTYTPTVDLPYGRIFWRVGVGASTVRYSSIDTFWVLPQSRISSGRVQMTMQTSSFALHMTRQGISITYSLVNPGNFSANVFSLSGNWVASLNQNNMAAGNHTVVWNGCNREGRIMPNGKYLVVCRIDNQTIAKSAIFIR